MIPRDRIFAALNFQPPDVPPLRIYAASGGLHEHGEKLVSLIRSCGHDFGDFSDLCVPVPPPSEDYDPDGRYHAIRTDEWGTTWEFRIFGVWGHPCGFPLDDLTRLDDYRPPAPPLAAGADFDREKARVADARRTYYTIGRGGSLFERLHSLRRFEDVLMDIAMDTPEINRVTDMLVDFVMANVRRSLALDVDAVSFADDFGTQSALMLSPEAWRRFFKPRYASLFAPIKAAGKKVFLHSCGKLDELLDDMKEIGVDVLWPQLPVYDPDALARRAKALGLVLELHPDRGDLMQRGSPADIRDDIHRLVDTFQTMSGGSWLYIEIDPGFPWRNVEALFETVMQLRMSP